MVYLDLCHCRIDMKYTILPRLLHIYIKLWDRKWTSINMLELNILEAKARSHQETYYSSIIVKRKRILKFLQGH